MYFDIRRRCECMGREDKKKINLRNIKIRLTAIAVLFVIILLVAIGIYMKMVVFNNKEGKISTISKSSRFIPASKSASFIMLYLS